MSIGSSEAVVIKDRLEFARRRMEEVLGVQGGTCGDRIPWAPGERDMLLQEFFFHLVGAIEFTGQYLYKARGLKLPRMSRKSKRPTNVRLSDVIKALPDGGEDRKLLEQLYCNVERADVPEDWDSDEAVIYRIWDFRHQVTHRGRIDWHINIFATDAIRLSDGGQGGEPRASHAEEEDEVHSTAYIGRYTADPERRRSDMQIADDLRRMWDYVNERCNAILEASPAISST